MPDLASGPRSLPDGSGAAVLRSAAASVGGGGAGAAGGGGTGAEARKKSLAPQSSTSPAGLSAARSQGTSQRLWRARIQRHDLVARGDLPPAQVFENPVKVVAMSRADFSPCFSHLFDDLVFPHGSVLQEFFLAPSRPPLGGGLLMRGHTQVAAWPCGQIANHCGFEVDPASRCHGPWILARINPHRGAGIAGAQPSA